MGGGEEKDAFCFLFLDGALGGDDRGRTWYWFEFGRGKDGFFCGKPEWVGDFEFAIFAVMDLSCWMFLFLWCQIMENTSSTSSSSSIGLATTCSSSTTTTRTLATRRRGGREDRETKASTMLIDTTLRVLALNEREIRVGNMADTLNIIPRYGVVTVSRFM